MRNALYELEEERKRRQLGITGKRTLPSGVRAFACDMGEPIAVSHRKTGPFADAQEDGEPQYEASQYEPSPPDDEEEDGASGEARRGIVEATPQLAPAPEHPGPVENEPRLVQEAPLAPPVASEEEQSVSRPARAQAAAARPPKPMNKAVTRDPVEVRVRAAERGSPAAHGVFDRMNMGLATTYDAGAFDLLDALDAKIAGEEPSTNHAPPDPELAEHAQALEDLAFIHEAMSQKTDEKSEGAT